MSVITLNLTMIDCRWLQTQLIKNVAFRRDLKVNMVYFIFLVFHTIVVVSHVMYERSKGIVNVFRLCLCFIQWHIAQMQPSQGQYQSLAAVPNDYAAMPINER